MRTLGAAARPALCRLLRIVAVGGVLTALAAWTVVGVYSIS
jgi:hypothetical protein